MNRSRIQAIVCISALTAIGAAQLHAQVRGQVSISDPGGIRSVGKGTAVNRFAQSSFGVGSIGGYQPSNSVLSSSISQGGNFTLRPGAGGGALSGAGAGLAIPAPTAGGPKVPAAGKLGGISDEGGKGAAHMVGSRSLKSAMAYLGAVNPDTSLTEKNRSAPITSLVPEEPGSYRDFMEKGDRAFRDNDFYNAFNYFQLANDIGGNDPESLLSLSHTRFAQGKYSAAAHYLQRTIKYLPELPLTPMRPKGFFNDPLAYANQLLLLEQRSRDNPSDAAAHLVLAYLKWFDGQAEQTKTELSLALGYSNSPETIDSIQAFWDAMVASGKISGKLEPTTQPVEKEADSASSAPAKTT